MREYSETNFAFEVDIEEKTGKFLFDTGEFDQKLAEKIMLQRCKYDKFIRGCGRNPEGVLEINSSPVMVLSPEGAILPKGDTITTLLKTEKGFICQLVPYCWIRELSGEGKIYVMIEEGEPFSIRVINTPFDVAK